MSNLPLSEYARRGLRLDGFPVFDAHAHVEGLDGGAGPALDAQVAEMDRLGIDLAAISATSAIAADFVTGNDQVAVAARRFPGRFIGYCHVSAVYPEKMLPELERCLAQDIFRGIKLYQVGPAYDDPLYDPVYALARERRLPVLAHTWGESLTGFDRAAGKFPEVSFLAAHAGSGFAYRHYLEAAKRCPNFCLDLTYSREHTNMIERFVEELGPERIVWGTDTPIFSMAHQLGKVLFARIPDDAKRRILGETAARLFGIKLRKAPAP